MKLAKTIGVVVVDDEAVARRVLREILSRTPGVDCLGAFDNGADTLGQILHLKPEVVLIDFLMPGRPGTALASALKAGLPKVKIIMVTGLPGEEVVVEARQAGVDWLLRKPVQTAAFVKAIRQAAAAGELSLAEDSPADYTEGMAMAEAGLALPGFLTAHAFALCERHKATPGFWLALPEDAGYKVATLATLYGWRSRLLSPEWQRIHFEVAGHWLHRVRMVRGAYWLWRGTPPGEVAPKLKYRDVRQFYRAFHRFFALTTTEFIQLTRGSTWPEVCSKCHIRCSKCHIAGQCPNARIDVPATLDPFKKLSRRETEVLERVEEGLGNKEIAARMGCSENTVKCYLKRVSGKWGTRSRLAATARFRRLKSVESHGVSTH